MTELLGAIALASILGSLHCAGMCGPFAMFAGRGTSHPLGQPGATGADWGISLRLTAYHLGRLTTYVVMAMIVGSAALAVDHGGGMLGISGVAARLAGTILLAVGMWKLLGYFFPAMVQSDQSPLSQAIARQLAKLRQRLQGLSPSVRAYAIGATTTLLPCGWLYVFVLVAGATGHPLRAAEVMVAFWIGTLPILTALAGGFVKLSQRFQPALPLVIAVLLIATGWYTATGRAAADLTPLAQQAAAYQTVSARNAEPTDTARTAQGTLEQLKNAPLPCCRK